MALGPFFSNRTLGPLVQGSLSLLFVDISQHLGWSLAPGEGSCCVGRGVDRADEEDPVGGRARPPSGRMIRVSCFEAVGLGEKQSGKD